MDLILSIDRAGKRNSLESSSLALVGFQLLPHVQHDPNNLERLLVWQANCSCEWGNDPLISFITWCSSVSEFDYLKRLVVSLKVQSSQAFELVVLVIDDSFLVNEVVECLRSQNVRSKIYRVEERDSFGHSVYSVGCTSVTAYIQILTPGAFLHPTTVFALQKQLRSQIHGAEVVLLNELGLADDGCQPRCFWRKSPPDSFSVLCYNFWGEGFLVSRAIWHNLVQVDFEKIDLLKWQKGVGHWLCAIALFRSGAKVETLPLALFLSTRGLQPEYNAATSLDPLLKVSALDAAKAMGLRFVNFREDSNLLHVMRPELECANGSVQIVIPFRDQSEVTCRCLASIAKQSAVIDVVITLIDNGSRSDEVDSVHRVAEELFADRYQILNVASYFNFARLNNCAVNVGSSEYVLFLNNDVELEDVELITRLRQWAALSEVGLVGARLVYPDLELQSAGIVFAAIGPANIASDSQFASVTREVDSVSFACAMMRREIFNRVGQLDELLCPNGFGDALFGLRVREIGLKIVLCAEVTALHCESRSRSSLPEELERLELDRAGIRIPVLYDDFHSDRHPFVVDYSRAGSLS